MERRDFAAAVAGAVAAPLLGASNTDAADAEPSRRPHITSQVLYTSEPRPGSSEAYYERPAVVTEVLHDFPEPGVVDLVASGVAIGVPTVQAVHSVRHGQRGEVGTWRFRRE